MPPEPTSTTPASKSRAGIADARAALAGVLARLAVVRDTMRPQAVHLVEASRLAFAAGQLPLAEVVDAERMRLEVDVQIARLSGQADLAWAALETAVGSDLRPLVPATVSPAAGRRVSPCVPAFPSRFWVRPWQACSSSPPAPGSRFRTAL